MTLFDALNFIGGLSFFLFGMTIMGQALERRAGNGMKMLLGKFTTSRLAGLMTGLCVTAIIQSSSATTVMVVGFVNSGLMTLRQSINVIMGANIGTTVTAWILSLAEIDSSNIFIKMLKPSSFTPILAFIGLGFYMISKNHKRKETGTILLGFATLMFGMETMSGAVSVLRNVPEFQNLFIAFSNPVLGVLSGAILTAIIQSSSASVGILQALALTGAVSYEAAIPIIMGQNIGTCVTAIISALPETNKNAKRAALVHLAFNVIGSIVWLTVFCIIKAAFAPAILSQQASLFGIAICHSIFNLLCTILMLPLNMLLEKMVCKLIPDAKTPEKPKELDDRLLNNPDIALSQYKNLLDRMAVKSVTALKDAMECVTRYDSAKAEKIRKAESETDHIEDLLGTYLVKLTSRYLGEDESLKATEYMKLIGDYERIADHAVNILQSAEHMDREQIVFSPKAGDEYKIIRAAVSEILDLSYLAFAKDDYTAARKTEPLEQVIDALKKEYRTRHILRLQRRSCSVTAGFIWSDLLTDLGRVADHCSNISGCVLDTIEENMNTHENQNAFRTFDETFKKEYVRFKEKYTLSEV